MLNFISFSYLNNLTLERGGIGDKVQQNHYEESDPTERTLTTGRNFDRF